MALPNIMIPNDGAVEDLEAYRAVLNLGSVRLFQNNYIPVHTTVPADLTECSFTGYAPVSTPSFGAAFLNGSGSAEIDSTLCSWTFTAGAGSTVVYGLYVLNAAGTKVLAISRFGSPITLTPGSPTIAKVLQLTAISQL